MKPDRSNYEVWFIDLLDGNLNEAQVRELRSFLKENPDLAADLEMLPFLELKPGESVYKGKKSLIKSSENFSESQFEFLSIGYLENDLTRDQSEELFEIIKKDEEKKKIFDLISKLKLKPGQVSFPRKSVVTRLTIPQRIVRIAIMGLSAAATLAVLILAYYLIRPMSERSIQDLIVSASPRDTLLIGYTPEISAQKVSVKHKKRDKLTLDFSGRPGETSIKANSATLVQAVTEPAVKTETLRDYVSVNTIKVSYPADLRVSSWGGSNTIVGYHPGIMPPTFDPYGRRSNVDRFIARFFHEIIMKDKAAGDRPVGTFELAEAGLKGLNKLLGWEMVLQQNPDSKDFRSYHFSSRLMKINTPIRKISDIM